jgi:drug/metabolite transporter (DMT)-like permease
MATLPVVTALLDSWTRRRRPGLGVLAGLAAAIVGVAVMVSPEARPGRGASLVGDLLMLAAVAAWVVYTFLAQRLMARYPALVVTRAAMVVGAATLLPFALRELAFHPQPLPTPAAVAAVLYLGVLCSALGHLLWNAAIPALGVTLTTNLINGIPLVGVLTGVAVLGEPFTAATAIGGALILAGVALSTESERRWGKRGDAQTAFS